MAPKLIVSMSMIFLQAKPSKLIYIFHRMDNTDVNKKTNKDKVKDKKKDEHNSIDFNKTIFS